MDQTLEQVAILATDAPRVALRYAKIPKEETHRLSLEEKHQHAREALEHFRTAAKEQREQAHKSAERDIRGFALKFYTEEGNWDISTTPR